MATGEKNPRLGRYIVKKSGDKSFRAFVPPPPSGGASEIHSRRKTAAQSASPKAGVYTTAIPEAKMRIPGNVPTAITSS
jgi:hypothetical protein